MDNSTEKDLDRIADDFVQFFLFYKRMLRDGVPPGAKRFEPSRFVLATVLKNGPIPMSDIGRRMDISKPYMTALIDKLIAEGLVERIADKDDRRIVLVGATEAGRNTLKEFRKHGRDAIKKALSSLSHEDISALLDSMETMNSVVSKLKENDERKENGK